MYDLCHNIIFSTFSKLIVNCLSTERFVWEEIKFTFKNKCLIYIYPGAIESLLTCYTKIVCSGLSITLCHPFIILLSGSICVSVRPSVEISNKTVTAVEGDRLNFTCTASGKPKPKIAWTKVGHAIVIADTPLVPVVVDRPATADNMIQYQCTASNGVKTPATATVNITVYCKYRYSFFRLLYW